MLVQLEGSCFENDLWLQKMVARYNKGYSLILLLFFLFFFLNDN